MEDDEWIAFDRTCSVEIKINLVVWISFIRN